MTRSMTFERVIISNGLCLRLLEVSDAQSIYEMYLSEAEHFNAWLPLQINGDFEPPTAEILVEKQLEKYVESSAIPLVIDLSGRIIGEVDLHHIDWRNSSAELGYSISKRFQGQGLAARSVMFLTGYAFERLELNRLQIRCAVDNSRSVQLAENMGFLKEGILKEAEFLNGRFLDHYVFRLLASEWKRLTDRA